ncbi:MAG: entericidin A/B family lipoprotein [Candidatus Omnitrophica bacterium]|nr:entericidin A/B family lipoprotein [Candidatus Omnitrophota bacterium]
MKRKCLILIVSFVILTTLAGCETSQGVGRDVQKLGEEIEDI